MKNINTLLDACLETTFEFPEDFCLQAGIYGGLVMAAAVARTESEAQYPVRTLQLNFSARSHDPVWPPPSNSLAGVEALKQRPLILRFYKGPSASLTALYSLGRAGGALKTSSFWSGLKQSLLML